MKKIEAYLKPFRLSDLRDALAGSGFQVLRIHQAEELRPAESYTEVVQGFEYETDVAARLLVVLLVEDEQVDEAVSLLQRVARTGHRHDGRILISPVERTVSVDPAEASSNTGADQDRSSEL